MSKDAFAQAVSQALSSSAAYTYGALMMPDVRSVPSGEVRGTIPPPMTQWVIQGDQFDTAVLDQYRAIKVGETRMLVAGTGIGKTTKLPIMLVSMSGKAGLVLLPNNLLVSSNVKYVSKIANATGSTKIMVDALRSQYVRSPPRGAAIYFSTAEDFLVRFHADRSLIKRLQIDFIYLDEAHENTPAYYFVRMLVGLDYFSNTRVFYGTATCAGTSLILTNARGESKPIAKPITDFPIDNPNAVPMTSPLHFANITGRTLVFLPTDHSIASWEEYYDSYDVKVLTFRTFDSTKKFETFRPLLERPGPLVLLSFSKPQTGITLDIDVVVCTGYTQDLVVDYSEPSAALIVRPVTAAERTQRMGRVGRHMDGVAYYCDVKVSPPEPELTMTSALYVWMWAKMFNIHIKNGDVAQFQELMGEYSNEFIALMLCSRLHPVLIMPYLMDNGKLYSGWHIMRHVFHTDKNIPISEDSNEDQVSKWEERTTGPQLWLDEPMDYRSRTRFPDEWQALPAAAWRTYMTGETHFGMAFDNRSVVSALVPEAPKKSIMKPNRNVSVHSIAETRVSRPMSVMTTKKSDSPLGNKFVMPDIQEAMEKYSLQDNSKLVPVDPFKFSHTRKLSSSSITEEIPRGNSIAQWVESTTPPRTRRRHSKKSSSSGSSHDRLMVELKKVSPVDYKFYKLYPLDSLLLSEYLSSESAHETDFSKFKSLIRVHRNFSNLHRDHQERLELQNAYFLSVIRVHNHQVMEKLQIKASGADKPKFMERFMGKDFSSTDILIEQSTKLLQSMQFEGFFVGVDKRIQHTSKNSTYSPRLNDIVERKKLTARYFLHTANANIGKNVEVVKQYCFALDDDNEVLGTGWSVGRLVVMPLHAFEGAQKFVYQMTIHNDELKDFIVCKVADFSSEGHPRFRGPVEGETVLLLGVNPDDREKVEVGPGIVVKVGDVWCIDMALKPGYSGFAVYSVQDNSIIGLYRGYYNTTQDGVDYGHFTPATDFLTQIARAYA